MELLPHEADVEVEGVSRVGGSVRILARTRSSSARCPGCGAVSFRVHSRYQRRLLDTAIGGCEVVMAEGFAHLDVVTAEDGPDNPIPAALVDFLVRNVQ